VQRPGARAERPVGARFFPARAAPATAQPPAARCSFPLRRNRAASSRETRIVTVVLSIHILPSVHILHLGSGDAAGAVAAASQGRHA
jgi:hypothetical protein